MKKILNLFVVLTIMTSVFSCGKDDDNNPDNSSDDSLVGVWEMVELGYTTNGTTVGAGQTITTTSVGTGSNMTYTLEFTNDTFLTDGGYDINLVTNVQGQEIAQDVSLTDVQGTGEYTADETTITVESGSLVSFSADGQSSSGMTSSEPTNYTINSDGHLIFDDVSSTATTQQGFTTTTTVDFRMRFVKQ